MKRASIACYSTLWRVPTPFRLRGDHGLVFTSRGDVARVRRYGPRQEFITPHTREQNGMVVRVIRTLKERGAHCHGFDAVQQAARVIGGWLTTTITASRGQRQAVSDARGY